MQTQLLLDLFGSSPHVMICVKDTGGRYLAVNEAFVRRVRRKRADDVIGFTANDFFPTDLALAYEAEDQLLLHTGRATKNQLEVITDPDGRRDWFLTNRVLYHESAGDEPVIVAASNRAHIPQSRHGAGAGLQAAIELVEANSHRSIRVAELAAAAGMSNDSLERSMRRVLGVSPKQYIMRSRVDRAASILVTTTLSLSEVASRCGYYDQSQFTKYFRDATGLTPGEYRAATST